MVESLKLTVVDKDDSVQSTAKIRPSEIGF